MAGHENRRSLITGVYDRAMYLPLDSVLYDGSDFCNYGYWDERTLSPKHACENLQTKLLSFFRDFSGTILDVACGKGATTRFLLRHFPASAITGINISARQLSSSHHNAPQCRFAAMDATALALAAESFDKIICTEAAFHFDTRRDFLNEAHRILRPGGQIVLSDILFRRWVHHRDRMVPVQNDVRTVDEYRQLFVQSGFTEVQVVDCTAQTWRSFQRYASRWALRRRRIPAMLYFMASRFVVQQYLIVSARKP